MRYALDPRLLQEVGDLAFKFVSFTSVAIASSFISSSSTEGKLSRSASGSDSRNVKVETPIGFPIS